MGGARLWGQLSLADLGLGLDLLANNWGLVFLEVAWTQAHTSCCFPALCKALSPTPAPLPRASLGLSFPTCYMQLSPSALLRAAVSEAGRCGPFWQLHFTSLHCHHLLRAALHAWLPVPSAPVPRRGYSNPIFLSFF